MRFLWCLLTVALACAQTSKDEKGSIQGSVVNDKTGEPLKKAQVILIRTEQGARPDTRPAGTVTDASGRFRFTDLDPGRYSISAYRNGFARREAAGRSGAPPVLTVSKGQSLSDIVLRLSPAAIVTGRITDQDGEPLEGVRVQALRYRYMAGKRQLVPWGSSTSDDRGQYRIHGLAAGSYYLQAVYSDRFAGMGYAPQPAAGDTQSEGYAPVYFPGVLDAAQAAAIRLGPGDDREGTDFRLIPTRTVTLRGRVTNPGRFTMVSLLPRGRGAMMGFGVSGSPTDPNGSFIVRNVTPGSYVLTAHTASSESPLWASKQIEVGNTNLEGIELTLTPGVELNGRVQVEGTEQAKLSLDQMQVSLTQEEWTGPGGGGWGGVRADGTFTLKNLGDGDYRIALYPLPADAYLKSARLGDTDALEHGVHIGEGSAGTLEIVVSPNGGRIDGSVSGDENKPASGATVVLIPEADNARNDLYKTAQTDQYGRFSLRGITPGPYKLFAWDDVEPGAWQDPAFLDNYKDKGKKVTIEEKSRESADLTLLHDEKQ